jgi:hypothetical protein
MKAIMTVMKVKNTFLLMSRKVILLCYRQKLHICSELTHTHARTHTHLRARSIMCASEKHGSTTAHKNSVQPDPIQEVFKCTKCSCVIKYENYSHTLLIDTGHKTEQK